MKTLLGGLILLGMLALLSCSDGGGGDSGSVRSAASNNANLSNLTISAGELDQVFQSSQLDYTATVGFLATTTTVTPTTADDNATVTVNGIPVESGTASEKIPLAVGDTLITVGVTAADGNTTQTYTITVRRKSVSEFAQQAYIKASNTDLSDNFGFSVALSGDTLAVGAPNEQSNATGIDGDEDDNSLSGAGAVYLFTRTGTTWLQQAYIKASNTGLFDNFGFSVALSGDTLAVGAPGERSNATGINGDEDNDSLRDAGAVYVFTRNGTTWLQQAYIKASNTGNADRFGTTVALSGETLAVGAPNEQSNATGIDGDEDDNSLSGAGALYVFTRNGTTWLQQAYIKASNTGLVDNFGFSVALSGDSLAVGAPNEQSNATGIDGNEDDNSLSGAGAVYLFTRNGTTWLQQAYIKASNTGNGDLFGTSVALSDDTLAVGAVGEDSNATGINGDEDNDGLNNAGAAYVYTRVGAVWGQQAYVKASNSDSLDQFGFSVSQFGDTLAIGAIGEDSNATGINGDEDNDGLNNAGAAYLYTRDGVVWAQQAYVKASNSDNLDQFGFSVSQLGDTLVIGAIGEDSNATGINGDETDDSLNDAGAAYAFQ